MTQQHHADYRMSDGEIVQRFEALHAEVRAGFVDVRGDLMGLTQQVRQTNGTVKDLQLWRAQAKGFLLALTLFASIPTVVLAWMALREALQ